MNHSRKLMMLLAGLLSFSLLFAGCGDDDDTNNDTPTEEDEGGDMSDDDMADDDMADEETEG